MIDATVLVSVMLMWLAYCGVIDLHCHLLPGIDDGPPTLDGSLELARALAADGIEVVAATPHVRDDHPSVVPDELAGRCAELRAALAADGVGLEVVPGGELDLARGLEASPDELRLVSYGQTGRYLLVETPYAGLSSLFEEQLFELELRGFRLLLAHPERNSTFQDDPERLAEIVARGALLQVTASSLVKNDRRSRSARLARALVRRGLAHVIASDAHGPWVARAPISGAVDVARRLAGEYAESMARDTPAAILAGERPPSLSATPPRRGGLLRRLGRNG
jgi:protein-tyrosine phosphatase